MSQQGPIRLIYVTASMPFGPGEEFLVTEANELLRQGSELLIVPRSPKGGLFNQDGAGLQQFSLRRSLLSPAVLASAALECLRHPRTTWRVWASLSSGRSVSVFAKNAAVLPKGLWLARVARDWRADHVHAHWGRTTATMAMIASEATGIPWSLTLHRDDIAHPNLLATKMERAAFTRFISRSGMDIARRVGASGPPEKLCVIHMGVALPPRPAAEAPGNTGEPIVLCPAHLYPVKGHEHLIKAMGILKDRKVTCRLWIAGQGHLLSALNQQVVDLGLSDRISFLGQVPHERILEWYRERRIDIVVLPSVDLGNNEHEGIPVALMEAMAHEIPVISTQTGGIPELIGGGAGSMVPPQDPEALADALEALVVNPCLRSQIGLAGKQRVKEQFAVERTVAELMDRIRVTCEHLPGHP